MDRAVGVPRPVARGLADAGPLTLYPRQQGGGPTREPRVLWGSGRGRSLGKLSVSLGGRGSPSVQHF